MSTPPLSIGNQEAYLAMELLDFWRREGQLQYLVNWVEYGPEEC